MNQQWLPYASAIVRREKPPDWPKALERVPMEYRGDALVYLKGMADRLRVLRAMRHPPPTGNFGLEHRTRIR